MAKAPEVKPPEKPIEPKPAEIAKPLEAKQPGVPKAPDPQFANHTVPIKQTEVAKIPEAKELKAPEVKQSEVAKAPELKLEPKQPEAQKPEMKLPEVSKPALKLPELRKPELKLPEISRPALKVPELPKPEAKQSPIISAPVAADKAPVLKIAIPQLVATEAKPPANILKPTVETKPAAAIGFPAPPKAEPKAEIRIEPASKLNTQVPNGLKPAPAAVPEKPAAKAEQKPDVNTNAKAVVEQANALPGVAGAAVVFEDGLSLAGKLPDDVQAGGLCAMAPSILQRINRHTVDTKFGPLVSTTLTWRDAQLSFFMTGTVCLAALHSQPVLPAETHRQLAAKVNELSRIYAQPGEKHVHH